MKKFKIYFISLLIIIFITSCDYFTKKKAFISTKQKISKLYNKKIIIPDSLQVLLNDSIHPNSKYKLDTLKYKIITRINANCFSCVKNLERWTYYMNNDFEASKNNIIFIIYIEEFNFINDSTSLLNVFPFPFLLDKYDLFLQENGLPEDKRFHTMLLNNQNRVILFGDPTFSSEIRKLYIKQIEKIKVKQ